MAYRVPLPFTIPVGLTLAVIWLGSLATNSRAESADDVIDDYASYAEVDFLRSSQGTLKAKQFGEKGWHLVVEVPPSETPTRVTLTARDWDVLRMLPLRGGGGRLVRAGGFIEVIVPADGVGWFFLYNPFPDVSVHQYQPKTLFKLPDNTPQKAKYPVVDIHVHLRGVSAEQRIKVMDRRARVMDEVPDLVVIGAHMGHLEDDLERLGRTLDKYPNFHVEMGVRHVYLGLQPHAARRFHIKYQDRILFGQDGALSAWQYRQYFRFFETDDDQITVRAHEPKIYGLKLPDEVLRKIYYGNAARLMPKVKERLLKRYPDLEFPESSS